MPLTSDAVFCIASPSLDAWTQSTGADGQAAQASDVQSILQQKAGATCPEGQTRLHVNTGQTAAYLVAYDARPLPMADGSALFAFGFGAMLLGPRIVGLLVREGRKWARDHW